eukprot:scaffold63419_cov22-Tisochrysis_lutea.AAC.1
MATGECSTACVAYAEHGMHLQFRLAVQSCPTWHASAEPETDQLLRWRSAPHHGRCFHVTWLLQLCECKAPSQQPRCPRH